MTQDTPSDAEYIALYGTVICSHGHRFEIVYDWNGERYKTRKVAIMIGFSERGSDDFNIGVIRGNRLVELCWMSDPVDTSPESLADIASQIGLS